MDSKHLQEYLLSLPAAPGKMDESFKESHYSVDEMAIFNMDNSFLMDATDPILLGGVYSCSLSSTLIPDDTQGVEPIIFDFGTRSEKEELKGCFDEDDIIMLHVNNKNNNDIKIKNNNRKNNIKNMTAKSPDNHNDFHTLISSTDLCPSFGFEDMWPI